MVKLYKRGALCNIFSKIDNKIPLHKISEYSSSTNTMTIIENKKFGKYPVYDANGIVSRIAQYDFNKAYVAIIKDGSGVGRLQLCQSHSSIIGTLGALSPVNCSVAYLFAVLQTIDFRQFITGMAIPHIYYKDYKNTLIPYPDEKTQYTIEKISSKLDIILNQEIKSLNLSEMIKKSLLQQLFI